MTSPIERSDRSKRQSRGWSDAMDGYAIAHRLAMVEQLFSAWLALKNARRICQPSMAELEVRKLPTQLPNDGVDLEDVPQT
jgi:hypothetical protein